MPWVHRVPIQNAEETHTCEPPVRQLVPTRIVISVNQAPDAGWGSLWRCDYCGKLWTAWTSSWREASTWQRLWNWRKGRES